MNKKYLYVAALIIVLLVTSILFYNKDNMKLSKDASVEEKLENFDEISLDDYLDGSENEYLVFVYNSKCKDCDVYINDLLKYSNEKNALKVYVINVDEKEEYKEIRKQFGTNSYSILIHVKDGKEVMRYFGTPDIYSLPKKSR